MYCFVRATAVNEMEPQTQERNLSNSCEQTEPRVGLNQCFFDFFCLVTLSQTTKRPPICSCFLGLNWHRDPKQPPRGGRARLARETWSSEDHFLSKLYNRLLHRPTNDAVNFRSQGWVECAPMRWERSRKRETHESVFLHCVSRAVINLSKNLH